MTGPGRLACAGGQTAGFLDPVADLAVLPDNDGRFEVVDHKGELGGGLPPVRHTTRSTELAGGEDKFDDPMAVLPQPQQPIARHHAERRKGPGEPFHPLVELRPRPAAGATDSGGAVGPGPGMLGQHVPERVIRRVVHASSTTRTDL